MPPRTPYNPVTEDRPRSLATALSTQQRLPGRLSRGREQTPLLREPGSARSRLAGASPALAGASPQLAGLVDPAGRRTPARGVPKRAALAGGDDLDASVIQDDMTRRLGPGVADVVFDSTALVARGGLPESETLMAECHRALLGRDEDPFTVVERLFEVGWRRVACGVVGSGRLFTHVMPSWPCSCAWSVFRLWTRRSPLRTSTGLPRLWARPRA